MAVRVRPNPFHEIIQSLKVMRLTRYDAGGDGENILTRAVDASVVTPHGMGHDQGSGLDPMIDWQGWFPRSDSFDLLGECDPLSQGTWQDIMSDQRCDSLNDSFQPSSHDSYAMTNDLDLKCPADSMSPLSSKKEGSRSSQQAQGHIEDHDSPSRPVELSGLEWRRAKNRTAASKCRAKQKVHNKALQKEYEQKSAQNVNLKRHERKLRELVTSLRDLALQHDVTRCRCKSLHKFNMRRAEQISLGVISLGTS